MDRSYPPPEYVAAHIDWSQFPARGPRGSPQNLEAVSIMATEYHRIRRLWLDEQRDSHSQ